MADEVTRWVEDLELALETASQANRRESDMLPGEVGKTISHLVDADSPAIVVGASRELSSPVGGTDRLASPKSGGSGAFEDRDGHTDDDRASASSPYQLDSGESGDEAEI